MRTIERKGLVRTFDDCRNGCIENKTDLRAVISNPAYRDMTPRQLRGIGSRVQEKNAIFDWLTGVFAEYFQSPARSEQEFDRWHSEICNEVCRRFTEICESELMFGKAQKIINISLKHFYCFSDAEKFAAHFTHCHMALDTYTLSWYTRMTGEKLQINWSNLQEEGYIQIQRKIREHLKSERNLTYREEKGEPLTPFQAEFYIWREEQLMLAGQAWLNKAKKLEEFPAFRDDQLMKQLQDMQSLLRQITDKMYASE